MGLCNCFHLCCWSVCCRPIQKLTWEFKSFTLNCWDCVLHVFSFLPPAFSSSSDRARCLMFYWGCSSRADFGISISCAVAGAGNSAAATPQGSGGHTCHMCGERFTERQSLITHIEEHKRNGLLMYFNLIDGKMSNATPAQQVDSACQQIWLLCHCLMPVVSLAVKLIDIAALSWKCPRITHMVENSKSLVAWNCP